MVPIAVATRVGPWLGRLAAPAAEKALAVLTKIPGVKSIKDAVTFAMSSKANAFLVFSSLSSAGFAVSDLFSPTDKADPEARQAATSLAVMEQQAIDGRLLDVAKTSESLSGLGGNREDLKMLQQLCVWARGHYGSIESAQNAFRMHQAFFELSPSDLDTGFELLM